MKTVSKARKVQTAPKAKQAEKRNGARTEKQIAAYEYRNELHYLRFIMQKTGLAPAEIAQVLKTKMAQVKENEAARNFRAWLLSNPGSFSDSNVTLVLPVELHSSEWLELAALGRKRGWTLEEALSEVLTHGVEDYEAHLIRKRIDREWSEKSPKEKAAELKRLLKGPEKARAKAGVAR